MGYSLLTLVSVPHIPSPPDLLLLLFPSENRRPVISTQHSIAIFNKTRHKLSRKSRARKPIYEEKGPMSRQKCQRHDYIFKYSFTKTSLLSSWKFKDAFV